MPSSSILLQLNRQSHIIELPVSRCYTACIAKTYDSLPLVLEGHTRDGRASINRWSISEPKCTLKMTVRQSRPEAGISPPCSQRKGSFRAAIASYLEEGVAGGYIASYRSKQRLLLQLAARKLGTEESESRARYAKMSGDIRCM